MTSDHDEWTHISRGYDIFVSEIARNRIGDA